jgi:hypothetical protein
MSHDFAPDGDFFFQLFSIDEQIAEQARAAGCICGGRLHRADFPRKPRGVPPEAEVAFSRRFSFCCEREGCRQRCTPPSVRFLGRRVYVGAVVVLCCVAHQLAEAAAQLARAAEIQSPPPRTVRRWSRWWQTAFLASRLWQAERGRFMPPVSTDRLPGSLLERFAGAANDRLEALLRWLSWLSADKYRSSMVMVE